MTEPILADKIHFGGDFEPCCFGDAAGKEED
jgi:hypothetical protein